MRVTNKGLQTQYSLAKEQIDRLESRARDDDDEEARSENEGNESVPST